MQVSRNMFIKAGALALVGLWVSVGTAAKACTVSAKTALAYGIDVDALTAAAAHSASGQTLDAASKPESSLPVRGIQGGTEYFGGAQIVGLWKVTFTSGGQVVDVGFETWHSDGTEFYNDIAPPAEGNVCMGVWAQTGKSTYKLYHPAWLFDSNGNLIGTAIIRITATLSANASKYNGTYTYDTYDNSGNSTGHFDGTVAATRITVNN